MSGNNNFADDGNRKLMIELIQLLETGYIRNSSTENPANSECTENSQPADSNELDIRMYLENKLSEANGLSRNQMKELAARALCVLANQNKITDALVRNVDERIQDLADLKQSYKNLEIQINSLEKKILTALDTIQNPDTIQFILNNCTVATQVNRDALIEIMDLAAVDESTSPNEAPSTADSEQVPIAEDKAVSNEDSTLADEETAAIAKEPSSPKESQKSVVQQIVNTQHPGLPIMLATESSSKPIAPAPQIKIHLLNNQVALTWSMLEEDLSAYEQIRTYQVYCCRETSDPPTQSNWWKLIELPAQPLPMSCVVEKCTAGKYYFTVRGIDVQMRIGLFSLPIPVIFDV